VRTVHRAYVGLGANVGDAVAAVERAFVALGEVGRIVCRSSLYRTKPWGKTDQEDFVNAVASIQTTLAPRDLLAALKAIEVRLGRTGGERWGPRVIDLDLLTYDDLDVDESGLHVPHPHLRERAFVLVPLADVDSNYERLRDALPSSELAGVKRIA
jgi:2-amino-4-hydroxy-6-hydroxymethyldihydropteridine diphosphokinase